jgi:hypothetical protein
MRKIVLGLIATPAAQMLLGMSAAQGTHPLRPQWSVWRVLT